jgi:hypothetical protein
MSNDPLLMLFIVGAAASIGLVLRYAVPKIELRGHTETHNGIRVREVAFTWLRGKRGPADSKARPNWLECVVYVTLKS